jgi:putative membrane protein
MRRRTRGTRATAKRMSMQPCLTVLLVALILTISAARADARPVAIKTNPNEAFATHAMQRGMAEVAFGQLAVERATNAQVKQLAQRIVADHVRLDEELMDLARNEGWEAPDNLDPEHRTTKARLSVLTGAAFDHEYVNAILEDHARYIALIREYAQHGKNAALTSWAARTLVTLRRNQQLASVRAEEIKAASRQTST